MISEVSNHSSNATPFDHSAPESTHWVWWRWLAFTVSLVAIWFGYMAWRPPGPILGIRHVEHLGRDTPYVALNFDDAPHPVITPLLLASLKRSGVPGNFFAVGDGLKRYPELARRLVQEGHLIANHSQNHHNLTRLEDETYQQEIEPCFEAIAHTYRDAGIDRQAHMFRPPGGGMNRSVMNYLWQRDITLAWWSNNVGDWARPPGWKIVNTVTPHLRPGDIILLHDAPGGYGTPQAIPAIVRAARKQNLEFVHMPDQWQTGQRALK